MTDINLARDDERDQEQEAPPAGAGVTGYPMNEASASSPTDAERQAGSTSTSTADRVSGYTRTEADAVDSSAMEGGIESPVRGEDVEVGRETRVREEVEISKEPVEHTEQVSGTVRREQASIEDETTDRQSERMPDSWGAR